MSLMETTVAVLYSLQCLKQQREESSCNVNLSKSDVYAEYVSQKASAFCWQTRTGYRTSFSYLQGKCELKLEFKI